MEIQLKRDSNDVFISIAGRLDTQASPELAEAIDPLLEEAALNFNVDIRDMEYISSSGVRCFVMLLRAARETGGSLKIENMRPEIREIFDMTGLSPMFGI